MTFSGNKPEISLKGLKIKNINRIVFGQININSLLKKFEQLRDICKDSLDRSFPRTQFHIPDYCSPCSLDRNSDGGEILFIYQRR